MVSIYYIRELKDTTFLSHQWQLEVSCFLLNLSSHNHITLLGIFPLLWAISLEVKEKPLSWHANCSLLVSIHGSKTLCA